MPVHARNIGPRFKVAEVVEITSFIHSQLAGQSAKVIAVRESRHAQPLDKYVLLLEGSVEQHILWDIELKPR
jgi:D-arabinose 5-phosphate isomerase GutQ